jgi:hypothetical protein
MEELRPHIAGLAVALGRLAVAYRPQRRLVELRLMSDLFTGTMASGGWRRVDPASQEHADIMRIGDQIRATQMHDLSPHRWLPVEYMEEAMFMMAINASLDDVDPTQRLVDNFYDPEFVPNPADPEDVAALPTATVAEIGETCHICLEDMQVGDSHHVLPCGHVMHHACTTEWFRSGTRCPACNSSPFPA